MSKPTHLSLFSGIGGLDLAAEWAGFETVGQCEWADYPRKVLEKHWPDVPRWRDIHDLTGDDFYERTGRRTVDVISGGFPCQPFSVAGKQKGKGDDRYLWPQMCRVIAELEPRWVVGENVPGILHIAAADVVQDLERLGFECVVFDFEAAAVGAPHRRERVAFVAHRKSLGLERDRGDGEQVGGVHAAEGNASSSGAVFRVDCEAVANTDGRTVRHDGDNWRAPAGEKHTLDDAGHAGGTRIQWPVEPDVGRVFDGIPEGLDEVGGLSSEAKARAAEILRNVWGRDGAKALQWTVGRFDGVSKAEVLLAYLCEHAERCDRSCFEMESEAAQRQSLRELWRTIEAARSSHRREYSQQFAGEYSDALFRMSHGAPSLVPQAWFNGAWEDGMTRVAHGIPRRVDRLRCLGNAVVPQQFFPIFRAIKAEIDRERS